MTKDFDLVVTVLESDAVVAVKGELDFDSAPRFREQILQLINQGIVNIVVDLSEMDFVDSSGLGVLVGTLKRMRERGGTLILRSPSANASRVLEVCGLDKLLLVS